MVKRREKKWDRSSSVLHTKTHIPRTIRKNAIPVGVGPDTAGGHLRPHSSESNTRLGPGGIGTAYCRCSSRHRWCECGSDARSHSGPCRRGRTSLAGSGSPGPSSSELFQHSSDESPSPVCLCTRETTYAEGNTHTAHFGYLCSSHAREGHVEGKRVHVRL